MTALLPPGVKVHLAFGHIDMRKGIDGLAMLVQGVLRQDPFSGHLFLFNMEDATVGGYGGRPVWWYLVAAAFALAALEWYLYQRRWIS